LKVVYNRGIYLPEIDLWMDARRPREMSVVSHAHADHIQSHQSIIATPATARLFEYRVGRTRATLLDFYETSDMGSFKLTFYPAGHCLGSAQTLIEHKNERVLYTGDFKLRGALSCEPPEIVPCDTLIIDCTFGQPHFKFPETAEVHKQLYEEVDRAFMFGLQPTVFGYSLGKGQEALQVLLKGGYTVAVHRSIMDIVEIYRDMGVTFDGDYRPLDLSDMHGMVALMPPGALRGAAVSSISNLYTIYLSGWGMDPKARYRYRTHTVLPFSDHAGFDDLERYVFESGAKKVYTVYGDHSFAAHLRRLGRDAEQLQEHGGQGSVYRRQQKTGRPGKADNAPGLFDLIEKSSADVNSD
jgi:putative mRNA 3-end processing factor